MTDIPAGWYDDPEDATQYRYWDGGQWSEHRSPKAHPGAPGGDEGVWSVVGSTFQLLGRGWRELVVLALPLVAITLAAGVIAFTALDSMFDPGLGDIIDRVSEPGFDPVNDASDEAFIESIDVSVDAGAVLGLAVAAIAAILIGTAATFSFTVFLGALHRGRRLSPAATYRLLIPRLPRILGILILWGLCLMGVLLAATIVSVVAIAITPLLLLIVVPLLLAAIVYAWPFGALATTTLALAPTDDPPLRRTITLIKPRWPPIAGRLLVLTLILGVIGFSASLVSGPFTAASVGAGFVLSWVLQSIQSVLNASANVVLYDFADGPVDPVIADEASPV